MDFTYPNPVIQYPSPWIIKWVFTSIQVEAALECCYIIDDKKEIP